MRPPDSSQQRTFFPTAINTFRQCPERYFHKYIKKRKGVPSFSRPMIMGGATHRMIASVLPRYMQTGDVAADLESRALEEISTSAYPDEEQHYQQQDARDVVDLTLTALDMIPPQSRSLLQERKLFKPLGNGEIQIGAQIDLVVQTDDGAIEHIDFKTGKIREDAVQALMARTVVGHRYGTAKEIRTTTLYLAQRQRHSATLTRETSRLDWQSIAQNIRDIRSIERFPPNPGPLCEFCPYRDRNCSVW